MQLQSPDFSLCLSMQVFENNPSPDTLLTVKVTSGAFSGQSVFDIDAKQLCAFCNALTDIYQSLRGTAEIREPFAPEQYLTFTGDGKGRIHISGHLQYALNQWRFESTIDQTFLPAFIKALTKSCASFRQKK